MTVSTAPDQAFLDHKALMSSGQLTHCYRRYNIRKLIAVLGINQLQLSDKLGYTNSTFLGQMIGVAPIRNISEKTARKIEAALGLDHLSLDAEAPFSAEDLLQIHAISGAMAVFPPIKRKYTRTDFDSYRDTPESLAITANTHTTGLSQALVIELLRLVELNSEGVPLSKMFRVLTMGVIDAAKKSEVDRDLVLNLLDLSR